MYSCEQDHTAAAARTTFAGTGYHRPCAAAPRSLQPAAAAHRSAQQQVVLPGAAAVKPRRGKSKKHGGASRPSSSSSSRRSSTTVVATDVNNFRSMVQELTGFPPAAIFRPLPRRVHAASPFVGVASGGCSGSERHGHGGSAATNNSTAAGGGGGSSSPEAPDPPAAALPVMAQPPPPPQCAPLGVFDGLADLGSPEFDSWGDLSIE